MNRLLVWSILIAIIVSLFGSIIMPYRSYEQTTTPSLVHRGTSINDTNYLKANVTVNNFNLITDLAITDLQQTKGLDVKANLQENEGMLFVFQKPAQYYF